MAPGRFVLPAGSQLQGSDAFGLTLTQEMFSGKVLRNTVAGYWK
jgi:hypothetical protein